MTSYTIRRASAMRSLLPFSLFLTTTWLGAFAPGVRGAGVWAHSHIVDRIQNLAELSLTKPVSSATCGGGVANATGLPACGQSREADDFLVSLMKEYPNAYKAGAAFPDWGYPCPSFGCGSSSCRDIADATHWMPFQAYALRYIHETYPNPDDPGRRRVLAFLLGVSQHQLADQLWHGLGRQDPQWSPMPGRAYIRAMGGAEFDCNGDLCGTAHAAADIGADYFIIAEFLNDIDASEWDIPHTDLLAIYREMGFQDLSRLALEGCVQTLGGLAVAVEKTGRLERAFSRNTPFQEDELLHHPVGGLDDMALRILLKWRQQYPWMVSEDRARAELFPQFIGKEDSDGPSRESFPVELSTPMEVSLEEASESTEGLGGSGGERETSFIEAPVDEGGMYYGTAVAVADFDMDGLEDIAIGAPGFTPGHGREQAGMVHIRYGNGTKQVIAGSHMGERFGQSMAACDINNDGVPDLAVGSPWGDGLRILANYTQHPQRGQVSVFLGQKEVGLAASEGPGVIIHGDPDQRNLNLGLNVVSGDLDGDGVADLILASPQAYADDFGSASNGGRPSSPEGASKDRGKPAAGVVAVFLSGKSGNRFESVPVRTRVLEASWVATGRDAFDSFGEAVTVGPDGLLIVGEPKRRQSRGGVRAFRFASHDSEGEVAELVLELIGQEDEPRAEFGRAVAIGQDVFGDGKAQLVVGSPHESDDLAQGREGAVRFFELEGLLQQASEAEGRRVAFSEARVTAQVTGDHRWARLGQGLLTGDLNGDGKEDLITTEPHLSEGDVEDAGALYVHLGGSVPDGSPGARVAKGTSAFGRLAVASEGGKAALAIQQLDGGSRLIIAGCPHHSTASASKVGRVYIIPV